jgi:UDP-N-acetylglucosamine:LPS N-acetylglucosamine transferase
LTQKQMGMACYYADIWLTRAGTTSLAEQKLYGLKLLLSPIPRTHDQYDNARYYVNHYGAILLDQNKDFQKQLSLTLDHYKSFKKKIWSLDITGEIDVGKRKIWERICAMI